MGDCNWLKAQPGYDVLDRLEVLLLLGGRIGVIVSQIANAPMVLGETKINGNGLAMAQMEMP